MFTGAHFCRGRVELHRTAYYEDKLCDGAHTPGAYAAATNIPKHACAQQQNY